MTLSHVWVSVMVEQITGMAAVSHSYATASGVLIVDTDLCLDARFESMFYRAQFTDRIGNL